MEVEQTQKTPQKPNNSMNIVIALTASTSYIRTVVFSIHALATLSFHASLKVLSFRALELHRPLKRSKCYMDLTQLDPSFTCYEMLRELDDEGPSIIL